MYVYIRTESELYTAGFYDPSGKWQPESDHATEEAAAQRVHWLNGGKDCALLMDKATLQRALRAIGGRPPGRARRRFMTA